MALIGKKSAPKLKLAIVPDSTGNMLKCRAKHDKHCWQCHKKHTTTFCTTCLRSFHDYCVSKMVLDTDELDRKCEDCTRTEISREKCKNINLQPSKISHLLNLLLSLTPLRSELQNYEIMIDHDEIIKPITYATIEQKLKNFEYVSTGDFLDDIKLLRHNCRIASFKDKELMKMVNELIVYCNNEIYDMDLCFECYERKCTNPDNLMLGLCKVPHLALWVKHDEFPYWPAKLLNSVHSDKVEVVFFSQCDTALVPSKNCLLFSVENPNDTDGSYAKEIADSYKEAIEYTECIKKAFGVYNFPAKFTPYDPKMEKVQMKNIIPTFNCAESSKDK